jgi:hypothetical protein
MSSEDEQKENVLNSNTRKKQDVKMTSEVIIVRGDLKKIVDRASKDLENDGIF